MDNSSDSLVRNMQKYVENLSLETSSSNSASYYYSSPTRAIKDQASIITQYNTQVLFSNNYCDVSQNGLLLTNYECNPINQQQKQQQFRPITKKQNINEETSSAASTSSDFSPSSYNSPNMSLNRKFCKQRRTPKKVLPVRSEAIDLSEHIENAKILKQKANKVLYCTFCKNNGEKEEVYCSHLLKDSTGKITCPVLKTHVCPICHETGEKAHTLTYCKDYKKSQKMHFLQMTLDNCRK